jgi:hypothetical protein
MNTKTTFRVLIVVLLALALTALAAAQDEQPAQPDKALPAVIEKGESASPAANLTETEWNNSFATANPIHVGDVISGKIKGKADLDYFKIDWQDLPEFAPMALIDIDAQAQVNGSALDAMICLYDRHHVELACNDDSDGLDSLLYAKLRGHSYYGPYYIRVQDLNYPNEGGDAYTYTLSVYWPLLVSGAKSGQAGGVRFTPGDVLSHYDFADGTEKWMLFFDASDMGLSGNLVALTNDYDGESIFLTLQTPQTLWVDGAYEALTPYDEVGFRPSSYGHFGPSTYGEFTFTGPIDIVRGADWGLSGASEKIDALAGVFWVSTTGTARIPTAPTAQDEDFFNRNFLVFDGSNVPGLAAEDVVAGDHLERYRPPYGTEWYLTILGGGVIDGKPFTQKDIFVFDTTYQTTTLYWHGPDHGFNVNIDAFEAVD